jgi:superfamily II DNA/RNA helicase
LEEDNVCEGFEDMGLKPEILKGIYSDGFEKPAYIQQRAIVLGKEKKDIIVQAQSGMGKTAALVITILQRIDPKDQKCQALILCPTRELAEQVIFIIP